MYGIRLQEITNKIKWNLGNLDSYNSQGMTMYILCASYVMKNVIYHFAFLPSKKKCYKFTIYRILDTVMYIYSYALNVVEKVSSSLHLELFHKKCEENIYIYIYLKRLLCLFRYLNKPFTNVEHIQGKDLPKRIEQLIFYFMALIFVIYEKR